MKNKFLLRGAILAALFFCSRSVNAQTISGQVNVPCNANTIFGMTIAPVTDFFLNLNCTVSSSQMAGNLVTGQEAAFTITQDGVGGHPFTWPVNFLNTPAINNVANGSTAATFQYCGPVGNGNACPANNWQNTDIGPAGVTIPGTTTVPQQLCSDTFSRANETPLSFGGIWTNLPDNGTNVSGQLNLVSNGVQGVVTSGLGNTAVLTGCNASQFLGNSNQWAKYVVLGLATGGNNLGVFLNVQPNANKLTGVSGQLVGSTGGLGTGTTTIEITSIAAGLAESVLASTTGSVNVNDVIEFDHIGPFCSMKQNGVPIAALTNIWCGALPGGGLPSIHTNGAAAATTIIGAFSAGIFGTTSGDVTSDTFTQGSQNPLPVGFWTTGLPSGCNLQIIAGNIVEPTATATNCYAFYTHNNFPENQSSEVKINALTASSFASPVVHGSKVSSTIFAGYQLRVPGATGSAGSVLILRSDAAGTFTTIETIPTITPNVNDVFKLVAVNNPPIGTTQGSVTLTAYQNGVQIGTPVTDTVSVTSGVVSAIMQGYPGISLNANAAITGAQIIGPWQSFSNTSTFNILQACGITSTCAKSLIFGPISVIGGPVALVAGTLTITSLPFSSSTSYVCTPDDSTGINGFDVIYNSGNSVTFNGTGTDTFRFHCTGN